MMNARAKGAAEVEDAAFEKLVSVLPAEAPGTFEYDFWRSIHTLEEVLSLERGRTTRLARTRQKIARVGIRKVLEDFAMHPTTTEGYEMLISRGLSHLTGEAVVLRHATEFTPEIISAAERRLQASGIDTADLI
jgi:hypothetical protein